jgi:hypothetical protein
VRRLAVVGVLLLAACAPVTGTVTEKKHIPAHYAYGYCTLPLGKASPGYGMCMQPACYRVTIEQDDSKGTTTRCIRKSTWDRTQPGDRFDSEERP